MAQTVTYILHVAPLLARSLWDWQCSIRPKYNLHDRTWKSMDLHQLHQETVKYWIAVHSPSADVASKQRDLWSGIGWKARSWHPPLKLDYFKALLFSWQCSKDPDLRLCPPDFFAFKWLDQQAAAIRSMGTTNRVSWELLRWMLVFVMSASHSTDSHDDKSSKQGFLFVNNNVGQRKHNSKTVRSHAARGTGRPRNTTVLRTPRTGLWILPENEIIEMKREVERDLVIGRSMTMFPGLSPSSMNKIFSCEHNLAWITLIHWQGRAFNQLTQALYPTSFCSVFPIAGCAWVTYLNQEPVNNLIFPYLAESFFGGFESAEARRLLARILPLIQANIEDPQRATSDGNISAVLALASAADVSGDLHGLKQHVHGLSSLVSIRGGISRLYHTELQIKCSRWAWLAIDIMMHC